MKSNSPGSKATQFDKSLNTIAWKIRKESAANLNCKVLEVSWGECVALAKEKIANNSKRKKRVRINKRKRAEDTSPTLLKYLRENGRNKMPELPKKYKRRAGKRIDHLKPRCIKEIKRVIDYFSSKNNVTIPMPEIIDFKKRGKSAGTFYFNQNRISLHEKLLIQERDKYIKRTPIHEAVHYCEWHLYGSTGHGARWKTMMMEVGADPTRCHRYNTKNIGVKKPYKYICDCKEHFLSQIQHERAQRRSTYWCTLCKNTLIFKEKEEE